MKTVKSRRVKVGDRYFASGYGRSVNRRNIYEIDGKYYAYHPQYAEDVYEPLEGELKGYVRVNQEEVYKGFHGVSKSEHRVV